MHNTIELPIAVAVIDEKDVYDLPRGLMDVIAFLAEQAAKIPEEFQGEADLQFESYVDEDGDPQCNFEIWYSRPPTAEEVAERETAAAARSKDNEASERDLLQHLANKYGVTLTPKEEGGR